MHVVMPGGLAWALIQARKQTLFLAADIPASAACGQTVPGEQHPCWILGHLLLADTYLLHMLGVEELSTDFNALLASYGPGAVPGPERERYDTIGALLSRLREIGEERLVAVSRMTPEELLRPLPDPVLVQVQPTIAHHISTMIYHEGYHGGQLAAWRRNHQLTPVSWTFAPLSA